MNSNYQQPPPTQEGVANSHPQEGKGEVTIQESSTGTAFFVNPGGNEAIKEIVKKLGGAYNAHQRGYRFANRDYDKVCDALVEAGATGIDRSKNLVDPRKIIEVEFVQRFQWPGDIIQAEDTLKKLGMTKKQGRGNAWTGDLSKAGDFLNAFNIGQGN